MVTSSPAILRHAIRPATIAAMDEIEREDVVIIMESLMRLEEKADKIIWLLGDEDGEEEEEV